MPGHPKPEGAWRPVVRAGGELGWQASARRDDGRVHEQIMTATSQEQAKGLAYALADKLNGQPAPIFEWVDV